MSLERDFNEFARQMSEDMGELKAGVKNLTGWVAAQGRDLKSHIESPAAHSNSHHGNATLRDVAMIIGGALAGGATITAALWKILSHDR